VLKKFKKIVKSLYLIKSTKIMYSERQKIAILWVYHSSISTRGQDMLNFRQKALEEVNTKFHITIPLSTVLNWIVTDTGVVQNKNHH